MEDVTVCEICGKLAPYVVIDLWRVQNDDLRIYEFEPQNKTHYFCDEHKRESRTDDK